MVTTCYNVANQRAIQYGSGFEQHLQAVSPASEALLVDTKDVNLFLAIARIGSISRTAEQLFMSQSTVTTRLQRLERQLGYSLFQRLPNGLKLTTDGERLVPIAERMATLEASMLQPVQEVHQVLRVMSGRAFVSTDVPACLTGIVKQTNVHLQVRMGLYDEMMDALLAEQVEFCFLGEPIYHPLIKQVSLPADAIDLVVPRNHYFAHSFPGLSALNGEPFIAFGRADAPFRKRVFRLLAEANVFPPIRMELDSIDGIKAMVSHGLGVSFLPRRTLFDSSFKHYSVISLDNPAWTRPTFLAYPASTENNPLTERFKRVVQSYYGLNG